MYVMCHMSYVWCIYLIYCMYVLCYIMSCIPTTKYMIWCAGIAPSNKKQKRLQMSVMCPWWTVTVQGQSTATTVIVHHHLMWVLHHTWEPSLLYIHHGNQWQTSRMQSWWRWLHPHMHNSIRYWARCISAYILYLPTTDVAWDGK